MTKFGTRTLIGFPLSTWGANVVPPVNYGKNIGYIVGGSFSANLNTGGVTRWNSGAIDGPWVQRYSFLSETFTAFSPALTAAIYHAPGVSDAGTKGFTFGCQTYPGVDQRVHKLDFVTEVVTYLAGTCVEHGVGGGIGWGNKAVAGYRVGGLSTFTWTTSIEKINFATETLLGNVTSFTAGQGAYGGGTMGICASNSGVNGYSCQGYSGPGNQNANTLFKMAFSTDTVTNIGGATQYGWQGPAATLNNQGVAGYASGGYQERWGGSNNDTHVAKIAFTTDTYTHLGSGNLAAIVGYTQAGLSNTGTNGCWRSVSTDDPNYQYVNIAYQSSSTYTFATETGYMNANSYLGRVAGNGSSLSNDGN